MSVRIDVIEEAISFSNLGKIWFELFVDSGQDTIFFSLQLPEC